MIVTVYDHPATCQKQDDNRSAEIGRNSFVNNGGEPAVHIYLPSIQETTKETL
jgi:hypothetical protein